MKTLVIYHKNCFDGICAAWVVSRMYPNALFVPYNYGENFYEVITKAGYKHEYEDNCIFVDISLPRIDMEALAELFSTEHFQVIDHHKTAEKNLEGLDFAIFDMNESGASLAWKTFFPDIPVPVLVKYVRDRDLWKHELQSTHEINAYMQSFPMTIDAYDALFYELRKGTGIAHSVGAGILRYKNETVQRICDTAKIQSIHGYDVPVVNTSVLFSEVPDELLKRFPDAPFAAYYYDMLNTGKQQWGLRSMGDFDVAEIAKLSGGGGHKNAAGFRMEI